MDYIYKITTTVETDGNKSEKKELFEKYKQSS